MKLLAAEIFLFLILSLMSKGFVYGEQGCTEKFMELSQVTYRAQHTSASATGETWNDKIRALQEYQFNCSFTNITSLILGIDVRRATGSINLFPSVRVYRPSNDPGKYDLVTGSERTIYYSTSNVSTSGVFEYLLNPPILVMSEDVLAIVQPLEENSIVRVYYISDVSGISFRSSQEISISPDQIDLGSSPTTDELILVYPVTDGYCVNSDNSITPAVIRNNFLTIQSSGDINDRRQYLYPEIVFSCNGSVTRWIYGGEDSGNNMNKPELQIWRQLGPNNYNKTGSSLVNASTMIGTNLYEFIPQTPLQFQEGDIFGAYSGEIENGEILVLHEQKESGPTNLRIRNSLNSPPSTIDLSHSLRTVNNDFPLVTVEISVSTVPVVSITTKSSPVISITSFPSAMSSPSSTESFLSPSNSLSQTLNIVSQSTIAISLSQAIVHSSETLTPTSTIIDNAIASTTTATTTTNRSSSSSSGSVSFMTTTDDTLSSTSSSNVIGNASNTSGSMTVIIGAVSSLLLLVTVGLVVSLLVVITACRIKRKKNREIDSEERDSAYNNPTYGDNHYTNTEDGLCINSKQRSYSYEITNDVYGEQELVGSLNPLLPTNDGISNTLITLEMNEELYGNNETEGFYSEAVAVPTSAPGIHTAITNESTYHTLQRELCVPKASERKQTMDEATDDDIYSSLAVMQNVYSMVEGKTIFFVEDPIYWEPGTETNDIYQQLSDKRYREIPRKQIKITGHLGSGQFGSVSKGVWESPTGPVDVAIKTLNNNTSEDERVKFLQEAAIMGQFHHPNIVKLHGMVTVGEPAMIVLELMKHGEMRKYLRKYNPAPGELVESTVPGLLLSFCRQIASGMEYLSKKGFVHRDLAARNILIADHGMCKIADFGMSRDLQDENYYISNSKMIPIKWTAPEALHFKRYSSASDVWSYGVVMYEIWSLGHKPFENYTNQKCLRMLDSGFRLPPPPGCPRSIYEMMIQCWHPDTGSRPTFVQLVSRLSLSDVKLLSTVSSDTTVIGGPLETGYQLYTELQNMYQ